MVETIDTLCDNPFEATLDETKMHSSTDETVWLQRSINKMGALLRVAFGRAGAEIISKNMDVDVGGVDPMIPGKRVKAIFGFCDIRRFTDVTEVLQEDVMLFVNQVAYIVHQCVVDAKGDPNKNIGDAFLIVWRLGDSDFLPSNMFQGKQSENKNAKKSNVYDDALRSFVKVMDDIKTCELCEWVGPWNETFSSSTAFYRHSHHLISPHHQMEPTASALNDLITNPKLEGGLSTYEVRLGFGLHVGWAIEGTIGSKHKVEASYLSPHVNLAARLESATKQYGVTYLYSEAFYTNLSKRMKKRSRHIDCVCVKGSSVPMNMYTYLRTPLPDFQVFAADLGRLERKLSSDICGLIVSTLFHLFAQSDRWLTSFYPQQPHQGPCT